MDSFSMDSVKVEKANAMLRYRRIRKIANLFRLIEVCMALILFSWFSSRLPVAVKIFSEYFRDLCVVLVSPRFVFLLGNAIVITLFAKSGQFSGQNLTGSNAGTDLYDQVVKSSENNSQKQCKDGDTPAPEPEEIVYGEKQTVVTVCEEATVTVTPTYRNTVISVTDTETDTKVYRRSQSENLKGQNSEKPCRELRRSETEKCWKVQRNKGKSEEIPFSEDDMSNEEFRRKIEAFIEKQQRFRREESLAIVLQNQS